MTNSRPSSLADDSETPDNAGRLLMMNTVDDDAPAILSTRQRRDRILISIFIGVLAITAVYNFLIATPRYASQFSYVIRSASPSRERFNFMNFSASGESSDNSEAIVAFIKSRDMVALLNRDRFLSRVFGAPGIDPFSSFPSLLAGEGEEQLFRHYLHFVDADFDEKSDITYIEVQAFSAKQAQTLAERIRQASEDKVNGLNVRARAGLSRSAELEVDSARAELSDVLRQLQNARNRNQVLDPKLQSGAAVRVASASAEELAAIDVEIAQTMRTAPGNPGLALLKARRNALRDELDRQFGAMAGSTGSLADRIRGSEELAVARDAAEKRLLGASLALASARNDADRNRLYLEWISRPSRPDEPLYPRKGRNLLIAALLSAALLWIMRSLSELLFDADE